MQGRTCPAVGSGTIRPMSFPNPALLLWISSASFRQPEQVQNRAQLPSPSMFLHLVWAETILPSLSTTKLVSPLALKISCLIVFTNLAYTLKLRKLG